MRRVSCGCERLSLQKRSALRRACAPTPHRRVAHLFGRASGLRTYPDRSRSSSRREFPYLRWPKLCALPRPRIRHASRSLLDVFGHPLLLVGVTRLISAGHGTLQLNLYSSERQIVLAFQRKPVSEGLLCDEKLPPVLPCLMVCPADEASALTELHAIGMQRTLLHFKRPRGSASPMT